MRTRPEDSGNMSSKHLDHYAEVFKEHNAKPVMDMGPIVATIIPSSPDGDPVTLPFIVYKPDIETDWTNTC
jgi:hypothetical protein